MRRSSSPELMVGLIPLVRVVATTGRVDSHGHWAVVMDAAAEEEDDGWIGVDDDPSIDGWGGGGGGTIFSLSRM